MTKLTMISVWFRGVRHTRFVQGTVHPDGSVSVSQAQVDRVLDQLGVRRGDTYTLG